MISNCSLFPVSEQAFCASVLTWFSLGREGRGNDAGGLQHQGDHTNTNTHTMFGLQRPTPVAGVRQRGGARSRLTHVHFCQDGAEAPPTGQTSSTADLAQKKADTRVAVFSSGE